MTNILLYIHIYSLKKVDTVCREKVGDLKRRRHNQNQ